ncbi:MAG: DUF4405 domain-containing protein [Hominilimicola sp.]
MKRKFKIILDVIMLLMTLTLFSKQLISMQYHEIAGLVLIAVIIIHIAVNVKIALAMCKNFIKIPVSVKTGLIVDILLLICFGWIGISGVLCSHTILTGISSDNTIFKLTHMFAGGASVILLGVHIGLHICRKPMSVIAAVVLSVVVLFGGIYGAVNSSEGRWLSIPFTAISQSGENGGNSEHDVLGSGKNTQSEEHQNAQQQNQRSENAGGKNRQPLPMSQKVENVIMFLGMILSCSMITYWIAIPKKKKVPAKEAEVQQ